jgi:hypothetical protein
MMCAWKAQENIDFNFCDLQLEEAIDSTNEQYIKRVCRGKLNRAGTYILLIGADTSSRRPTSNGRPRSPSRMSAA